MRIILSISIPRCRITVREPRASPPGSSGAYGRRNLARAGLVAGALAASAKTGTRPFRFVVVNDTHYMSPECGAWLAGVVRQMKSDQPEFCLLAGDLTEHGRRET